MSDLIAPKKTVTFTIEKVPHRLAQRKTIERLMRMEPKVRRGLKKLGHRRVKHQNTEHQRGGRMWLSRVPMTRLTQVEAGGTFTLTITPQIMADITSVEKFLKAKAAK